MSKMSEGKTESEKLWERKHERSYLPPRLSQKKRRLRERRVGRGR